MNISTKNLDHLGIVASTIEKLGIVKYIDDKLPLTARANTTIGERVAAMIFNGLGFMDTRLYMFSQYLETKPVNKLFREEISAQDFNDDSLGRALDAIHEYGTTKFFSEIATAIALEHDLIGRNINIDTTSLSLEGDYEGFEDSEGVENNLIREKNNSEKSVERDLSIDKNPIPKYGYAKNKRNDLKQMILLLATTGKANIPIYMEAHSGNTSDKQSLETAAQRIDKFCSGLKSVPKMLFVGDSAMYDKCVKDGKDLLWMSRVPSTNSFCKKALRLQDIEWSKVDENYKMHILDNQYYNKNIRYVLYFSTHAYEREIKTLESNIKSELEEITKIVWHFDNQKFDCEKDLRKAASELSKKLKYHQINYTVESENQHNKRGRPAKNASITVVYYTRSNIDRNEVAIENVRLTKGRFILATNQLDKEDLPDSEILTTYKQQSGVESGFKFIKDNSFEVDSVFLKTPSRIEALMVVMTLCLLVYSYSQYFLRKTLKSNNQTIELQSGRQSNNPTMKWIYKIFHGTAVVYLDNENLKQEAISNLNSVKNLIIRHFGMIACRIYGISLHDG